MQRPIESSQYTSISFTENLELEGIRPLVGTVAGAYDNVLMEIVIELFKIECIRRHGLSRRAVPNHHGRRAGNCWMDQLVEQPITTQ